MKKTIKILSCGVMVLGLVGCGKELDKLHGEWTATIENQNVYQIDGSGNKVGGKEDDLDGGAGGYTDPAEAAEFVHRTGVDFLAVAIGTAHGVYKGIPKLDLDRLSEIRKVVSIPLVLHGTSGVPDETVKECIKRGICKVNYATDLRIAFTEGVKSVLTEKPDTIDPKKYNAAGREKVKEYVMSKMLVCGSNNRC